MANVVFLMCTECKNKNYVVSRARGKKTAKLSLKKYCKHCRRHTLHKESK